MAAVSNKLKRTAYVCDSMTGSWMTWYTMTSHLSRPAWIEYEGLSSPWPRHPTSLRT
jgi:hypothetical protein